MTHLIRKCLLFFLISSLGFASVAAAKPIEAGYIKIRSIKDAAPEIMPIGQAIGAPVDALVFTYFIMGILGHPEYKDFDLNHASGIYFYENSSNFVLVLKLTSTKVIQTIAMVLQGEVAQHEGWTFISKKRGTLEAVDKSAMIAGISSKMSSDIAGSYSSGVKPTFDGKESELHRALLSIKQADFDVKANKETLEFASNYNLHDAKSFDPWLSKWTKIPFVTNLSQGKNKDARHLGFAVKREDMPKLATLWKPAPPPKPTPPVQSPSPKTVQ